MKSTMILKRTIVSALAAACLLVGGSVLTGCQNDAQTGAAAGGVLGAIAGGIIGHQSGHGLEGAAIGGAVGAGGGYIIGNEKDKERDRRYRDPYYNY